MLILATLFVCSVFTSALLLFLVEPMIAKMALPWFGGSPGVWNTSLLFFQTALLGGYAYSHASTRWLGPRRQKIIHAALLLGSLCLLPPALSPRFLPAPGAWPVLPLLGALLSSVGAPFFLLSTNSTLSQRWFSLASGREPYALYAASNAGSFAALLAYPLLIEPRLGLLRQGRLFSLAYGGFVALSLLCMLTAGRAPQPAEATSQAAPGARTRWFLLAMVPSLLLQAVSLRITTDIASVPLLWMVPLGIYLLTYVLAFLPFLPYPRAELRLVAMLFLSLAVVPSIWLSSGEYWRELGPPLGALLFGALISHSDLARDRPEAGGLTSYYLWIAAGSAAGGALSTLVAPCLFSSVAEYPLAIFCTSAVLVLGGDRGAALRASLSRPGAASGPIAMAVILVIGALLIRAGDRDLRPLGQLATLLVLVLGILRWRRPGDFLFATFAVALFGILGLHHDAKILEARRNFFGTLRVEQTATLRILVHGTTQHGVQRTRPLSEVPASYYHPLTPMGELVARQPPGARIGVVGLGAGALAALGKPGQQITFYEVDPMVEPMARRYFTYLDHSRAQVKVVLGDARLTLQQAPPGGHDLLIIDAFSSDSVPTHLLTVEAVALYLDRLQPGGIVAFHISNRHLDLRPVLRGAAQRLGLAGAIRLFVPTLPQDQEGISPSRVVALSRSPEAIAALRAAGWHALTGSWAPVVTWTDDRSSLLEVLRE